MAQRQRNSLFQRINKSVQSYFKDKSFRERTITQLQKSTLVDKPDKLNYQRLEEVLPFLLVNSLGLTYFLTRKLPTKVKLATFGFMASTVILTFGYFGEAIVFEQNLGRSDYVGYWLRQQVYREMDPEGRYRKKYAALDSEFYNLFIKPTQKVNKKEVVEWLELQTDSS